MKSLIGFLVGLAVIQLIQAQIVEVGPCSKKITTKKSFDSSKYLGRWYENQKYPFIFENDGKCIYAEYGAMENGNISVYNFNINSRTNETSYIKGSARIEDDGKLKVKFDSMPTFSGESDYWILDTDYNNYSVVYSCSDMASLASFKTVWILTRERNPQPDIVEHATKVIEKNDLPLQPLTITDQTDCGI